jgi:hypothetical protein
MVLLLPLLRMMVMMARRWKSRRWVGLVVMVMAASKQNLAKNEGNLGKK